MKRTSSQTSRPAKLIALSALAVVLGHAGTIHAADQPASASPLVFDGGQSTWHEDFVRYDYLMDKGTLEITPFTRPANERFGVGTPPLENCAASWLFPRIRLQAIHGPGGRAVGITGPGRVELLRRGFHIAFITPDPGKEWDAWYAFLTEKHGLSKKPAFDGMSKGGVNAYQWATANPDKVSAIYADNPAIRQEDIAKMIELALQDVRCSTSAAARILSSKPTPKSSKTFTIRRAGA